MVINVDTVIDAYVKTRNDIKALEEKISELKGFQAKKEEYFIQKMTDNGVDSFKSKHGTVYTSIAESVTVADQEIFFNWVRDNEAWSFMEKRASKSEILNYMGDKEDSGRPNPPPPGLSYIAIRKVGVRKS